MAHSVKISTLFVNFYVKLFNMRNVVLVLSLLLITACSGDTPENITQKVNRFIAQDNYEQAIDILNEADSTKIEADLALLREKVHLNYGIYLEYHAGEMGKDMRTRMTGALHQYIKTLKINPNNQKARAEINQIMSIYQTMPQSPPDDIMKELRQLSIIN